MKRYVAHELKTRFRMAGGRRVREVMVWWRELPGRERGRLRAKMRKPGEDRIQAAKLRELEVAAAWAR